MNLRSYRPLGKSGLIVSPLALGTMTFGRARWGAEEAEARAIFDRYVENGGNFIDTANVYAEGGSETLLGGFLADKSLRDQLVIATKSGFGNSSHLYKGGNGAKSVRQELQASLQRLNLDHVDLFWLHVWDMVTPVEEVLQTFAGLVRDGLTRYYALSNVPAWYAAKMCALAQAHGLPAPIALQLEYSLVERSIEIEHIDMARDAGLEIQPWSPLGGGFLSGKYSAGAQPGEKYETSATEQDARLTGDNPLGDSKFTARNWKIVEVLKRCAETMGEPTAKVALAWLVRRPLVNGTLIGARSADQLAANVGALDLEIPQDLQRELDEVSRMEQPYPAAIFTSRVRKYVFGGAEVASTR